MLPHILRKNEFNSIKKLRKQLKKYNFLLYNKHIKTRIIKITAIKNQIMPYSNDNLNIIKFNLIRLILILSLFTNCSKDEEPPLSTENKILSFELTIDNNIFIGQVDHFNKVITIETAGLESHPSLIPKIEVSPYATISPSISTDQNFNNTIEYTVTAQNGDIAVYKVITNNTRALSSEKKILSYSIEYGEKVYTGTIDHDALTIDIDINFGIIGSAVYITASEAATITEKENDEGFVNLHLPVTYTVTAEDGSTNDYVMNPNICEFGSRFYIFYSNAVPLVGGFNIDLTVTNSAVILENDTHSYTLTYSDYNVEPSNEIVGVSGGFRIHFPEDIVSASDYKLRYKVNGEIKAEAERLVDIIAENVPVINSSNQNTYSRGDTMILYGANLVPGILVDAHNGSDYVYFPPYLSVNNEKTELTFPMTINPSMFPSYHGIDDNYPTRIYIYHEGREGSSIVVDFN